MKLRLRTRFSLFLFVSIASVTLVGTLLFTWFFRAAAEKETTARGLALCQSLARAAAAGLAAEDLDLLGKAADIVRADDLLFAQVFSAIWSPIDAYPFGELQRPPAPEAIGHFTRGTTPLHLRWPGRFEFYVPIVFRIPQAPETTIGYARLALSAEPLRSALLSVVLSGALVGICLGLVFFAVAQAVIGRTVVAPILELHAAVARFRGGQLPAEPRAAADDEIADLGREFHAMSLTLREREARLSDEKERLAVTLRSIGDGVIVADADGLVTLLNRAAEELTGWSPREAVGRRFCEVFAIRHERSREPCASIVAQVLATGEAATLPGSVALVRPDGTEILVEDSAAPIRDRESRVVGIVLVFRDVTNKRRLEAELVKAEKLQSLGVLAGGIAHDFNNLLTGILGSVSLARAQLPQGTKAQERLENAEAAAHRAAELTAQLLTFSRGGAPVRRAAAVGEILRESAKLVLSGSGVAAEFAPEDGTWPAEVDPGQMSQVFNNLVLNAVQAMGGAGRIRFAVRNVPLSADEAGALPAGDYVEISLGDEGPGIAAEHLGRIFDPYFTTKPGGVGLGLASAYSIVQRHGGHIRVESEPGRGATFHILLPAARDAALPPARPQDAAPLSGHGSVLVMDDEPVVREVAADILRTLGYEPATAADGEEALGLYLRAKEAGRRFRAVIMDLTIPGGMGGKEAVARLLALDPAARVIVSSGYSNDPIMAEHRRYGFRGVVFKPYSARALARALQEVLAES